MDIISVLTGANFDNISWTKQNIYTASKMLERTYESTNSLHSSSIHCSHQPCINIPIINMLQAHDATSPYFYHAFRLCVDRTISFDQIYITRSASCTSGHSRNGTSEVISQSTLALNRFAWKQCEFRQLNFSETWIRRAKRSGRIPREKSIFHILCDLFFQKMPSKISDIIGTKFEALRMVHILKWSFYDRAEQWHIGKQ